MGRRSKRGKIEGRTESGPFLALSMSVLGSPQFTALSPRAVKALIDVAFAYRGYNNGNLCAAFKIMKPRGWTSKDQLALALQELVDAGFLLITRRGGNRVATLYALSFKPIDPIGPSKKYDEGIKETAAPPHTWQKIPPQVREKKRRPGAAGPLGPVPRGVNRSTDPDLPCATGH